ncbi:MAG: transposase [Rikenellaceae bacterium]
MLKKVHGISNKSAEDLVAEIGLDMNVFPSEKHLSLWVGIALGNNESAGKKSGRITHGNKQAKYVHLLKLLGQQLELKRLFTVQGIINWQAEEAKESLNRSRTLDPEICLQYIERRRRV